ncbi:MAG: LysR family transcriptional regulator [Burkholderiales bacterium]
MELRDLDYFAAIARRGSLARAAEELNLSPAALSKSLRRLETAIDAKLMERAPRGLALTSSGKLLLDRAERLRLNVEDVKREAAEMGAGRAGRLRVGVSQVDGERMAIACMTLQAEAPGLEFEVIVSTNDLMVPRVRSGELDLIVSMFFAPFAGVVHETLFRDTFVVYASPTHRLARRRRLTVADVVEERWVLGGREFRPRQVVDEAFLKNGFPPSKVALESASQQVRLAAVAHSQYLGFTSRRFLRQTATSGFRTVELSVEALTMPVSLDVLYRKDGYLSRAAQRLLRSLRSSIRWTD